ncbi:MAG TPA: hypothetical protein VEW48_07495 [Thermoanaerobaculia bacterium]|nr:hypothetical protein [Thermoanaerobaculia bacterium]
MSPNSFLVRRGPHLLLLILVAGLFLAGASVPYRVDTDTGFQLHPIQQWLRGEVGNPLVHRLPDPQDLSRDALVWSSWWPPGFPLVYTPLAAAGLRLANSLRATSFLLFLAGSLGWLQLAGRLALPLGIRVLYALSLAGYAATIGGAASLATTDILAYAAGPWLVLLTLRAVRRPAPLFGAGLAFGLTYWVRYSLFLTAVPLLAWLAFQVIREVEPGCIRRLAALGAGFAVPVLALFLLNLSQSRDLTETATGARSVWDKDERTAQPLFLAAGLAGAPGLGLFQNDLWMEHLTFFSDDRIPGLRGLDDPARLAAKCLLGMAATLALAWGVARTYRRHPGPELALALWTALGYYLLLTIVSALVGYNYLANEVRFAAGFLPFLFPFVLSGWLEAAGRRPLLGRLAGFLLLIVFFLAPLAFAVANFARNEIWDRRAAGQPSETGLFVPELSSRSIPQVRAAIAGTLRSPRDLVILAGPLGWGSGFMMWLEIPRRTLPVGTFFAPLGARYLDAADLRGTGTLRSSQRLRVVLVISRSTLEAGWLPRLQSRFPQARGWRVAAVPPDAAVEIRYADLEVP